MTYTIAINPEFKSVEIAFDRKPSDAIREALKEARFRWHKIKKVWYGYTTEENARRILEGEAEKEGNFTDKAAEAATENEFGIKVGDLFSASWGYEQTNVDFFQVVQLVGKKSVRVRQVNPPMIEETAVSGMSADRTYKVGGLELLPPVRSSVFIKDQERGDMKRLKSYAADGKSNPQFYLDSFADAHFCGGETMTAYESWYY